MLAPFDLIALDADDTLWHNEPKFYATQEQFRALLTGYHTPAWIDERLHETEKRNLAHFGYGVKGFVLSMIETAVELTEGRVSGQEVKQIIDLGRSMLTAPVELIDGVREAVEQLSRDYQLALLTKGDLFDQETKLARSGRRFNPGLRQALLRHANLSQWTNRTLKALWCWRNSRSCGPTTAYCTPYFCSNNGASEPPA